ncbi:MAG: FxDxF family PEP-CTERM protein [Sphingomicrobium sp.]
MRKAMLIIAGATALSLGTTPASAASILTAVSSTTLNSTGTSGPFGGVVVDSSFNDQFEFNLNLPSNTNGQISTISLTGSRDINFSSIFIDVNDAAHTFIKTSNDPNPEVWALITPVFLGGGGHTLFVNGSLAPNIAAASYSGTLNIAPVPEPATWAMMLLGFGGIGMTMRKRRRGLALAQIA